jgi:uncharacterized protein YkwD
MPPDVAFLTMGPSVLTLMGLSFILTDPADGNAPVSGVALARAASLAAASKGRAPLVVDTSLGRAAERHLDEVMADPAKARLDRLQAALQREGLADAQVLPFTSLGADPKAMADALLRFAKTTVSPRGMTHVGVGTIAKDGKLGLAAIFTRRLLELQPLPQRKVRAGAFVVRGKAQKHAHLEALLLTGDEILRERIDAVTNDGAFSVTLRFRPDSALDVLEILAETERGPEVTALWRFETEGRTPRAPKPTENDAKALFALVARTRSDRDVAPLDANPALDRAARLHAEAVCRSMIAAHVLPDGTSPLDRAKKAGWKGVVTENIAIASSIALAHANLLESPSHRLNVLDPAATTLGIGVVAHPSIPSTYCAVELFGFDQR